MDGLNSIYTKRGQPFRVTDYPESVQQILRDKLRPVEDIVQSLPRRLRFFASLGASQSRGLLRALDARQDWEDVLFITALTVELYKFIRHPAVRLTSGYLSPLDRFIAGKLGKTVAHMPRQFIELGEMGQAGLVDYFVHTVTPPDEHGFVNLGVNCDLQYENFRAYSQNHKCKVIFEINSHTPWVMGHKDFQYNRVPLAWADMAYEHHERLVQLPAIRASAIEKQIAQHVMPFIENGDTLQLGIGGLPNFIAEQLREYRDLKIHSEMLVDSIVDLVEAGAIDSHGKAHLDGVVVGTFAAGSDKLYDWIDRNPGVMMLPIREVNDPTEIGKNRRLKSINSCLLVDLNGQVASDAVGYQQISGIGGQLEFVMGAQLSEGGRSLLCLKSTRVVDGRRISSIVASMPPGTAVTIPRQCSDVIVTEFGVADLRHKDTSQRARALIEIAHPDFREGLIEEARQAGVLDREPGFGTFTQRAMFNHFGFMRKLVGQLEREHKAAKKAQVVAHELKEIVSQPDLLGRLRRFYDENKN